MLIEYLAHQLGIAANIGHQSITFSSGNALFFKSGIKISVVTINDFALKFILGIGKIDSLVAGILNLVLGPAFQVSRIDIGARAADVLKIDP